MSPKTPEQYKQLREEKKEQIMNVALDFFAKKTFQGTSISMIAKEAGISKGLIYNYFTSKEDLLEQIIHKAMDTITELFAKKKEADFNENDFEEIIHLNFELLKKDYHFWRLYMSLLMQTETIKILEEIIPEFIENYLQIYANYYRKKGLKNPEQEAYLLGVVLDGVSLNYILDPEHFPLEEMKQQIIEKFK